MASITLLIEQVHNNITCNTRLLQYYGLEGRSQAIPYNLIEQVNTDNFCPNLSSTCCTTEDFSLTRDMWKQNVHHIRVYLTQIFRVLQKVSMVQNSIIQYMPKIQARKHPSCRKIDSTFFNSPVKFDEMHFYIRNALEAFAYIQKGFYCTICDPHKHPFFSSKINYGRYFVQLSYKSCDDLMFFFREFLAYKVYFFDPLVKSFNLVLNCIHENDEEYFGNDHFVSYQGVSDCLLNKNYCFKVCKEFRMGASSNLFIGKLTEYRRLLNKMEEVISEMSKKTQVFDELEILDQEVPGEFFARTNDTLIMNNLNLLKDSNVSRYEILFAEQGIDLFYAAVTSNYFVTDETTIANVKKNYGINKPNPDDHNYLNPNVVKPAEGYIDDPGLVNAEASWDEYGENPKISPDAEGANLNPEDPTQKPVKNQPGRIEQKDVPDETIVSIEEEQTITDMEDASESPDKMEKDKLTKTTGELEASYYDKLKAENPDNPEDQKRVSQSANFLKVGLVALTLTLI